ncbi:MAG: 4'-phosphopantetheinyl transferase superfamily protein [Candidatus Omnitrophica bacterium]|nr:4'-phosphopantetheinyl transferase superfamily protein [Candidatus Omnitrophota bacterium]
MPRNKGKLLGIGIDLIAISRARDFLSSHRDFIYQRFLSRQEAQRLGCARKLTPSLFSRMFSAKEAYFKSLNEKWLGLGGFRSIEVRFLPGDRFRVKSNLWPICRRSVAEGAFFYASGLVGAQVCLWRS